MHLKKLILEQFRNHQKFELEFDSSQPVTYIVGENAQGKTNILEAIYLLALTKSFRTNNHEDMVQWETEFGRVKGFFAVDALVDRATGYTSADPEFSKRTADSLSANSTTGLSQFFNSSYNQPFELEVFLGRPPHPGKVHKKNGVKTSAANFIGSFQVVFFHPEDLNMLYLGPDLRRRYLDILNLQINKKYYQALRAYRRILEQRNTLLHQLKDGYAKAADVEIWDEQLIENGSLLIQERAKSIEFFHQNLQAQYRKISQGNEEVTAHYQHCLGDYLPTGDSAKKANSLSNIPLDQIKAAYQKALKAAQPKDFKSEHTSIGPHRDDLVFYLNGLPLSQHASRGEYRSLLLSLKLLELEFYQQKSGQKPLLLLDDVFSELDDSRQRMLLEAIQTHQTIITATHEIEPDLAADLNPGEKTIRQHQHLNLKTKTTLTTAQAKS